MQARPKGTCVCRKTPKPDQTVPHKPALAQEPDFVSRINVKKRLSIIFFALSDPLSRDRFSTIDLPGQFGQIPKSQSTQIFTLSRNGKSKGPRESIEDEDWAARRSRAEEVGRLKKRQRWKAGDSILAEE